MMITCMFIYTISYIKEEVN